MSAVVRDWNELPLTLRMKDIAAIYDLAEKTVRRRVEQRDPSIPRPNFIQPYRWRKADVRRHYETASLEEQRREKAWQRMRVAG